MRKLAAVLLLTLGVVAVGCGSGNEKSFAEIKDCIDKEAAAASDAGGDRYTFQDLTGEYRDILEQTKQEGTAPEVRERTVEGAGMLKSTPAAGGVETQQFSLVAFTKPTELTEKESANFKSKNAYVVGGNVFVYPEVGQSPEGQQILEKCGVGR